MIQGDADTDLVDYPDDAFDYVILSQTLQATQRPRARRRADAAHRAEGDRLLPEFRPLAGAGLVALTGRMPVNGNLPYAWYDTPNIHFCTIRDFVALASEIDATVERALPLDRDGRPDARRPARRALQFDRAAGAVRAGAGLSRAGACFDSSA